MQTLLPLAETIAERLKARGETISIAESSSGGLLSAALLAIPGASAYFVSGAVVYTPRARATLMDIPRAGVAGMRSASEPYALLLARTARERFGTTWALSETALPVPPAILTAMPPATPASRSQVRSSARSRWRPAAPTAVPIWTRSRKGRWSCYRK